MTATGRDIESRLRLNRDGSAITVALSKAVGTPDRRFIYRIEGDIAWLLPDLALVKPADVATGSFASEKQIVQSFYDDFGWVKKADGSFNDTAEFTDTRYLPRTYQRDCNARIGRLLGSGRFLLDVASGAIPHAEYLSLSEAYEVRICVDFSMRALTEARAKLGDRGIYLLADITRLPLSDESVDSVISLHTIYHVPKAEQTSAVDELVRVTRAGGRVIIVYIWAHSLAMDVVFKARGWLGRVRRLGRASPVATAEGGASVETTPPLYFHPQDHDWFAREVALRHKARLRVWSAVSSIFQTRFVSDDLFGRLTIAMVKRIENSMPWFAGRFGQYPMFIIDKKSD